MQAVRPSTVSFSFQGKTKETELPDTFEELCALLPKLFEGDLPSAYKLFYCDPDGDMVTMATNEEYATFRETKMDEYKVHIGVSSQASSVLKAREPPIPSPLATIIPQIDVESIIVSEHSKGLETGSEKKEEQKKKPALLRSEDILPPSYAPIPVISPQPIIADAPAAPEEKKASPMNSMSDIEALNKVMEPTGEKKSGDADALKKLMNEGAGQTTLKLDLVEEKKHVPTIEEKASSVKFNPAESAVIKISLSPPLIVEKDPRVTPMQDLKPKVGSEAEIKPPEKREEAAAPNLRREQIPLITAQQEKEEDTDLDCFSCEGRKVTEAGKPCKKCNGTGKLRSSLQKQIQQAIQKGMAKMLEGAIERHASSILQSKRFEDVLQSVTISVAAPKENALCTICKQRITGSVIYRCVACSNFFLCAQCEATVMHPHPLLKIKSGIEESKEFPSRMADTTASFFTSVPADRIDVSRILGPSRQDNRDLPLKMRFIDSSKIDDLMPGQKFKCTWVFENSGKRSWPAETTLTPISGDNFSSKVGRTGEILPGQKCEMTAEMVAPDRVGNYKQILQLFAEGRNFGPKISIDISVTKEKEEIKILDDPKIQAELRKAQEEQKVYLEKMAVEEHSKARVAEEKLGELKKLYEIPRDIESNLKQLLMLNCGLSARWLYKLLKANKNDFSMVLSIVMSTN